MVEAVECQVTGEVKTPGRLRAEPRNGLAASPPLDGSGPVSQQYCRSCDRAANIHPQQNRAPISKATGVLMRNRKAKVLKRHPKKYLECWRRLASWARLRPTIIHLAEMLPWRP
jgi:hypothetical protein